MEKTVVIIGWTSDIVLHPPAVRIGVTELSEFWITLSLTWPSKSDGVVNLFHVSRKSKLGIKSWSLRVGVHGSLQIGSGRAESGSGIGWQHVLIVLCKVDVILIGILRFEWVDRKSRQTTKILDNYSAGNLAYRKDYLGHLVDLGKVDVLGALVVFCGGWCDCGGVLIFCAICVSF